MRGKSENGTEGKQKNKKYTLQFHRRWTKIEKKYDTKLLQNYRLMSPHLSGEKIILLKLVLRHCHNNEFESLRRFMSRAY